MAKTKTTFVCQQCGARTSKWLGKCPSCGAWNTIVEEVVRKEEKGSWRTGTGAKTVSRPVLVSEVKAHKERRIVTGDGELDRVLGGGIVPGSMILLGGEPGIGKSTLMLQIALNLENRQILYISGEESEQQIKMRADRLGRISGNCYVLTETSLPEIFTQINLLKPELLIIDSIQTMRSDMIESIPGSVSQVRQSTAELLKYAKESGTPVFLIGHITKDGTLAGPKILEHMVDTVIQFEGDRHLAYRILRTTKNRYGSTSELGIYEMHSTGLREVSNPSEILISQREPGLSGIAIGASLEGNRPLLVEIQSLVSPATYGTPQRSSTGFDARRLNMLLAVLEKRGGYRLGTQDVFLNIAGGLKMDDPAIDLAVAVSIISSYEDVPLPDNIAFCAEIGLGGEIRAVNHIENRIREAEKLGFDAIYVSGYNTRGLDLSKHRIAIRTFTKLEAVIADLLS